MFNFQLSVALKTDALTNGYGKSTETNIAVKVTLMPQSERLISGIKYIA